MRRLGLMLLWAVVFCPAQKPVRYPLPARAKITAMRLVLMQRDPDEFGRHVPRAQADAECKGFHLTEAEVRQRFATYHEILPDEIRELAHNDPCAWVGTVILPDGKRFDFQTGPDHILSWFRGGLMRTFSDGVR